MKLRLTSPRKWSLHTLFALLFVINITQTVFAGDGTFTTSDGINGQFNFCVALRFNATAAQIQKIQKAFQKASDIIADATDGHHRFGTINIINDAGPEAIASAEFVLGDDLGIRGSRSTTDNIGYGVYKNHVLTDYIEFANVSVFPPNNINLTDPGLFSAAFMIAHEFGHHAYGLADEYSGLDLTKPNFEQAVRLHANCAPGANPGESFQNNDDPNLNYCLMDDYKQRGGRSVSNATDPRYTYSLDEFCVAGNHDKPDQNGFNVTTYQTIRHKGKSCWETMASLDKPWRLPLPDGLPNPNPPSSQPVTFSTSCGTRRAILLIDRSGSMVNDGRLNFAKIGANLLTTFIDNTYLGVVSFSNLPRVDYPLSLINNDTARNAAKTATNSLTPYGATNIGGGLQASLDELTKEGDCVTCPKTIILLTDGDHNVGTPPESVTAALQKAGVRVTVAVLGSNVSLSAETSLKNITRQTGGQYIRLGFFNSTTQPSSNSDASNLVGFFLRAVNDIKGNGMIAQQQDIIASGQVREYPVLVEQSAANATFTITKANQADGITLSLRTPSGTVITQSGGTNVEFISDSNSRTLRVKTPQPGTWTVIATAATVNTGKLEVLAFAEHGGVQLNAWVDEDELVSPAAVRVHAAPIYESSRVVGAAVTGTVVRPDGSKTLITMFDDGNFEEHGDEIASDGIYSASFNNYTGDGTYIFEVTAVNSNGRLYEGEFADTTATPSVPPFSRKESTTAIVSGMTPGDTVWIDDALPQGATPHGEGETWHWVDANPAPFMGGAAHQSKMTSGFHKHYFDGATTKLRINPGDILFTYVFLDPNNMPREIMLEWNDGNWEHRAYWGANIVDAGVSGTDSRRSMGALPAAAQWVRLEVPASLVGLEGKTISGMSFSLDGGRATWDRAGKTTQQAPPPPSAPSDFVWVEDAVPQGATTNVVDDVWNWVNTNPSPYTGSLAHKSYFGNSGDPVRFRSHSFSGAQTPMTVNPGDVLFAYVYLDPSYTPDEIMLQWNDGDGWEHRAFWGSNFVELGVTGTESRRFMGGLPSAGRWVRLEIPASYVGLEGKSVSGMDFGAYRDRARPLVTWDRAGKSTQSTMTQLPLAATTPFYRLFGTDYNGYYYYSTKDIGRADQRVQRVQFYIYPNQAAGTVPLYRFRSTGNRYFYTIQRNGPQPPVWQYETIAGYVYSDGSTPGTVPLYLFRDIKYEYFYTTTPSEGAGMINEGVACYVNDTNPMVPVAPSHLSAGGIDQIGLRWRDNSATETGFKLERAEYGLWDWTEIAVLPANRYKYGAGPAPTNGTPCFRLRATNAIGDSAYSNRACFNMEEWTEEEEAGSNTAPEISIISPINNEVVSSSLTVRTNIFDGDGYGTISKVEFFDGSIKLAEVSTAPYIYNWDNVVAGSHTLTATVTDSAGASTTSLPVTFFVTNPPAVSITGPVGGTILTAPANINITANASDTDGTISKVEFFQDTTKLGEDSVAPYNFTWDDVAAGSYNLTAIATDNDGATVTSSAITIIVNNPPTVNITTPNADAVITSPASINIGVDAGDSDGTISKVEFFQGETKLGEATSSPFSMTWETTTTGSFSITAKATDNRGATTTSGTVNLSLRRPDLVISQVYGGGGNAGATYKHDYIELFNRDSIAVDLTGWSVQYASASGVSWQVTPLSGSIAPGHHYLVQEAQGSGGTLNLPTPDVIGDIELGSTEGKVALVKGALPLHTEANIIIDLVGYGGANQYEGSGPATAPSNTNSIQRGGNGCIDINDNKSDFDSGAASPRNSYSQATLCATPTPSATVVISEFRTRGPNGGNDEFIELYNKTDVPVNIGGWKIKASNNAGSITTRVTISANTVLPAYGHFLVTNINASGSYSSLVQGDQTYTLGIADNGGVAITKPDDTVVDQVGMSSGSAFKEGRVLDTFTTNADRSYERKLGGASGSGLDTDDNRSDFKASSPSGPQNLSSAPTTPSTPSPVVKIIHIDVGQGDATLIIGPSRTLLFDSGVAGSGTQIRNVLDANGITSIDYFVAGTYDAAHIGAIDELLNSGIPINIASYDRGGASSLAAFSEYINAVGSHRATIALNQQIDLGGGCILTCLAVDGQTNHGTVVPVEENDRAVALVLRFGTFDYFIASDLPGGGDNGGTTTTDVESLCARDAGDVDVLHVGNHGSHISTNQTLVNTLRPEQAVISLGDGNPDGYPMQEVIDRLTVAPTMSIIWQTAAGTGGTSHKVQVGGTIVFTTNGVNYEVRNSLTNRIYTYQTDRITGGVGILTGP